MRIATIFVLFLHAATIAADPTTKPTLDSHLNKPLSISGKTFDGKQISTDEMKGKVVLVDFWATWCGPCVAELPELRKMYDQYHAKGLEVMGVSSDYKIENLKRFLAAHPEYPWPQLFSPGLNEDEGELHPIAKELGIEVPPVMILIDKQGVCRSVTAAKEMEQLVPKLLDER